MKPETFRKLAALGLSHEQMAGVLEIFEEEDEARKSKARERVQRWREKKNDSACNVTERNKTSRNATVGLTRVEDNKKTNNLEDISSLRSDNISIKPDFDREFEAEFWPVYPRKVGKGQALKAYRHARKQSDCETITAGARRYARERAGEDQQFTRHAATWLNGQGWLDEPAPKPSPRAQAPPRQSAFRQHQDEIYQRLKHETGDQDDKFAGTTLDIGPGDYRAH